MIHADYVKLRAALNQKAFSVSDSKAHDYADCDVLSNFKRVSKIAKLYNFTFQSPMEFSLFMCVLKMDRIMNLTKNSKTPKNESVEDTFVDFLNYVVLAYACYKELPNKTPKVTGYLKGI